MTTTSKPATCNRTDTNTVLLPRYKILLHNDDVNSMEHVVRALVEIFHLDVPVAAEIMMTAHKTGVALVKVETKEVAELRREQLQSKSLVATIEPE